MCAGHLDEEAVFVAALEKNTPAERSAYLDLACGDDTKLRHGVEHLLELHEGAHGFLETPPLAGVATIDADACTEGPGTLIGRYKLRELIGEGGFGDVYMAEQQEPVRRKVALKIIKLGMDTRAVIARFEAERQALALMDHPNIAKVLDAGATEAGRPYFVMDLVRGWPITEYCDANNLTTEERLSLFIEVCQAVQHAHQKGIIHRDIKPTNVLVTLQDTKPVPKIIDFGVAKATQQRLTEKTLFTEHRQLVGTPEYMSPEQATFGEADVDTRSDIYSLGVLLYELLVGTTPFDAEALRTRGYDEICRVIRESDPPTPSKRLSTLGDAVTDISKHRHVEPAALRKLLCGDLDWIVMKALEKDRTRRYETTNGLALDIERFLNDQPVEASPPSASYRLRKFVRRNRIPVYAAGAMSLALVVGIIGTTIGLIRAHTEADRASQFAAKERKARLAEAEVREKLQRRHYAYEMNLAFEAWERGNLDRLRELLTRSIPQEGEADLRSFEWYYLSGQLQDSFPQTTTLQDAIATSIAYSGDGNYLAIGGEDGEVILRDLKTGEDRQLRGPHAQNAVAKLTCSVAFSTDSRLLLAAGGGHSPHGEASVWELDTGREFVAPTQTSSNDNELATPAWLTRGSREHGHGLALSADGKLGASVGWNGTVKIWTLPTGELKRAFPGHSQPVQLALSPNGRILAVGSRDTTVKLWDVEAGKEWVPPLKHTTRVLDVAFSPDGKVFATASVLGVKFWDMTAADLKETNKQIRVWAKSLHFSPERGTIVTGGRDGTVTLWDLTTHQPIRRFVHQAEVHSVAFSPGGTELASASEDGTVKVWNLEATKLETFEGDTHWFPALAVSSDTKTIAAGHEGSSIKLWDTGSGDSRQLAGQDSQVYGVAFSPDGRTLASAHYDHTVKLWDLPAGTLRASLNNHSGAVWSVEFSHDGRRLASAGDGGELRLWRLDTLESQLLRRHKATSTVVAVAFSPDGKFLASGGGAWYGYGETKLWDLSQPRPECVAEYQHPDFVYCVAFSPESNVLAAGDRTAATTLWEVPGGRKRFTLRGHALYVSSIVFCPDGRRIATASPTGDIKFWSPETGEEVGTLRVNEQVRRLVFFPDGTTLVSASTEGFVRLWCAGRAD